ncbi:helix-turn-helix transcriptional regulator [Dictyobacter formicarum]|uniref:HTH cro/C1-type domain-containing protein n=1 Tax=Dictyobacter formicarum TaxID=2778368 RepID=A0ABQ3VDX8_9CHLR|nr:helix-turn-helix transcriptional regulator [Dictyobacter formicarum]GHO84365.1 hypothetical protein KSZ_23710 [Dictyobacter formicarum]
MHAAKEKKPNGKLRMQREMRGWSQKKVGLEIDTSKDMISRWETGERCPSPYYQAKLCTLFDLSAEELGFIDANKQENIPSACTERSLLMPDVDTQGVLPFISQAVSHGIMTAVRELEEGRHLDVRRRQFMQQALGATVASSLIPDTDILARLVRALKKPTGIDLSLLAHLELITKNNRQRFIRSQKSTLLLQDVSRHLEIITQLLESSPPAHANHLLCRLAAETSQLIGDILFNAGNNAEAERYYDVALKASEECNHAVLHAVILGRKSFIPLYGGDAENALPLLQEARTQAAGTAADVVTAWLWAVEAEVQARLKNEDGCRRALHQSERLIERGQSGEVSYTFADPSYSPFTQSHLLGYKGACYVRLQEPRKAQRFLNERLASMDEKRIHKKSITLVDLATTFVQMDEVEAACKHAEQALTIIEQTRSARVFQRVLAHRHQLERRKDTTHVKNLDAHIESVLPSIQFQGAL